MKFSLYTLLLFFISMSHSVCISKGLTSQLMLFDDQEWKAIVVLPVIPKDSEVEAAGQLVQLLTEVTGKKIRLVTGEVDQSLIPIYVENGGVNYSGYSLFKKSILEDSFEIKINSKGVKITGGGERGTLFGVYSFLEQQIGFRWFFPEFFPESLPDNMGTFVPKKTTIEVFYIQSVQKPDFAYRKIGTDNSNWSIRNKHNLSFTFIDVTSRAKCLIQINNIGHTFNEFISPEEYSHKIDFFSFYKGRKKNQFQLKHSKKRKLNLLNIELQKQFSAEIADFIIENSNVDLITIAPEDGLGFDETVQSILSDGRNLSNYDVLEVNRKWDQLGPEKNRVLSKRMTSFYKSILSPFSNNAYGKVFITSAYSSYLYAPLELQNQAFVSSHRFAENVLLLMCHMGDHNTPLFKKVTVENSLFVHSFEQWKHLYKHLGIYEYYQKASMLGLPFPIIHTIKRDIPFYKKMGVELFFSQMRRDDIGVNGLNCYVASKLLWDITIDVDTLLKEFFQLYYGPANVSVSSYFCLLEERAKETDIELAPLSYKDFQALFTPELLLKLRGYLMDARDVILNTSTSDKQVLYLARLKILEVTLEYTQLMMGYFNGIDSYVKLEKGHEKKKQLLAGVQDKSVAIQKFILKNKQYKAIPNSKYVIRALSPHLAIKNYLQYYSQSSNRTH